MFSFTLVFALAILGIQAQVPSPGKCPEIGSVQQNFDLNKYLGTWYEEEKYFAIFELGGKCNSAEYSFSEDGTVSVNNKQIDKTSGKEITIEGNAKPASTNNEGKFLVNFPGKGCRWYEAEKYFANFELGKKCIFADYSLFENGTMKVLNQDVNVQTQKKSSIEGNARPAGAADEAKLLVNFPRRGVRVDAPYWVLETDYDSYAVVWACSEYPMVSTKYAWILTRKRDPSEETLKKAYQVFERLNLSKKDLFKTDQKDCPIDE